MYKCGSHCSTRSKVSFHSLSITFSSLSFVYFSKKEIIAIVTQFLYSRYPDDEIKKNECCNPFNAPQLPAQWLELNYLTNINIDKLASALGYGWLRKHRLSPLYHMSFIGFVKIMIYILRNKEKVNEKLKILGEQQEQYGIFKDQL